MGAGEGSRGAAPGGKLARERRVLAFSLAVLVLLLAALAAVALLAGYQAQRAVGQQAGGSADSSAQGAGTQSAATTSPEWEVPDLPALLGLTRVQALSAIGRGAAVRAEDPVDTADEEAVETLVTVALAEERAQDGAGAPTVRLWVDARGRVIAAEYSAALSSYGYAEAPAFREALDGLHVVERALARAGVSVPDGAARAPADEASYATYRDDGHTLEREYVSYSGAGEVEGALVGWTASLLYDYSPAIESGNLADTQRILAVGVRS